MWLFFLLGYFLPCYPPKSPKNQIKKKKKNTPEDIIILHKCTKNYDHMLYCSWDMTRDRCNYFSFGAIFCPFTAATTPLLPLTAQKNQNFTKMKKNPGDIIIFDMYQILWSDDIRFLRFVVRQTDGWKKWQIEVGAPPKKKDICCSKLTACFPIKAWTM